jgi:hypothetical protein
LFRSLAGKQEERLCVPETVEPLAQLILLLTSSGERNMVVIASKAIGTLRQQYAMQRDSFSVEAA